MHTELGRSQVEVPVHTELGSWQRAWRRVGKAEDADMVEEKLEEEEEDEDEEEDSEPRRRTTLIKSNNPHLAGGEQYPSVLWFLFFMATSP